MKTLIELYDRRPLENVLATEMFRPQRTVYLCPGSVAEDKALQKKLREFFSARGVDSELIFIQTSLLDASSVAEKLRQVVSSYPDCAVDIAGGSEAALFAAGALCAEKDVPVFTYSRRKNRFFNIQNAPFASGLPCEVKYSVDDCFRMAGGSMHTGRVDNRILSRYEASYEPFFRLFLRYRRQWTEIINWFQRVSPGTEGSTPSLKVKTAYTVKGERGTRLSANESALRDLEEMGFLEKLDIRSGESVSFRFADGQIRSWLRDVGSVLELYIYQSCRDSGLFDDVLTSAVVDWDGVDEADSVVNELDVMATRGVVPVFISCKTCNVKTEALNELAILRDRFGGQIAKAAIVTAESIRAVTRHRAEELDIAVIDLTDLKKGSVQERLHSLMSLHT